MKNSKKFVFEEEHTINPHGAFNIAYMSHCNHNDLPNNTSVMVCGENDGVGVENPHFHIRIDNSFDFEVKFEHMHDLEIWRSTSDRLDWSGYEHVRDAIKEWLDEYDDEYHYYKNYESVLIEWNMENYEHEIDIDKYKQLYENARKFIFEDEHTLNPHGVYEIAWLSYYEYNNLPNNTSIMICGEKEGVGTENPHFHIRIDNSFDFEVKFEHLYDLQIWRSTSDKLDWGGYEYVRDAVKEWLQQYYDHHKINKNYEYMLIWWNMQNYEHEIDINKYMKPYEKLIYEKS